MSLWYITYSGFCRFMFKLNIILLSWLTTHWFFCWGILLIRVCLAMAYYCCHVGCCYWPKMFLSMQWYIFPFLLIYFSTHKKTLHGVLLCEITELCLYDNYLIDGFYLLILHGLLGSGFAVFHKFFQMFQMLD